VGIELRYVDANNLYRLSVSTTAISIIKIRGGTVTTLATASVSLSTGTYYRLRFRVADSFPTNLYGRVWADQSLEPVAWNVTGVDV